jgi:hypothetical protein
MRQLFASASIQTNRTSLMPMRCYQLSQESNKRRAQFWPQAQAVPASRQTLWGRCRRGLGQRQAEHLQTERAAQLAVAAGGPLGGREVLRCQRVGGLLGGLPVCVALMVLVALMNLLNLVLRHGFMAGRKSQTLACLRGAAKVHGHGRAHAQFEQHQQNQKPRKSTHGGMISERKVPLWLNEKKPRKA